MSNKTICLVDEAIRLSAAQRSRLAAQFRVIEGFEVEEPDNVEGLLLHSKVKREFLEQFPNLKWVGVRAKNTSYVPAEIKVRVFGIPSLAETAVAEHVFALMLGLAKNIIQSHDNVVRGRWREGLGENFELAGKTVGIIGFGTIGKHVGEMAKAFGMQVLVAASPRSPRDKGSDTVPLEVVLKNSDFVTLHLSSLPENIHFMNEARLALMKKGAILINTSRGDMVDEKALVRALKNHHLGGAGLDVFENEPKIDPELLKCENVIFTPHTGYITRETQEKMTDALIDAVLS